MWNAVLRERVRALLENARKQQVLFVTAESCTGGLVGSMLTSVGGSSDVVEGGFITYSNYQKEHALGVDPVLFERFGAVSEEVAIAMAEGALSHSRAHISVAVTGIAGPDGGTPEKPVGLVHVATAKLGDRVVHERCFFEGARNEIQFRASEQAIGMLFERV